jgi:hydrogenase-4 component B
VDLGEVMPASSPGATLLLALAVALSALSGLPTALAKVRSPRHDKVPPVLLGLAGLCALAAAVLTVLAPQTQLPFADPLAGRFGLDALQAWFLVPLAVLAPTCAVFATRYWPASSSQRNTRQLHLCFGTCVAGILTQIGAADAFTFLVGWEVMAISAFLLIATEDHTRDSRAAAWLYLNATHVASLALFAFFAIWLAQTGSLALDPLPQKLWEAPERTTLFWLMLLAFGLKAGLVPLHFWLPSAHAATPGHVSALMSGMLIKMGIFGLLRFTALLGPPPLWWGLVVLAIGMASALFGVVSALGQHDLKRLLAYHSVENVGIIALGLGTGLCGWTMLSAPLVVLGFGGALLHTWNHALFKGLLFLSAASVVHATGTRRIDALGGLLKVMPRTGWLFLAGAVAICGLPPLNGFVSELLVFLGMWHGVTHPGSAVWLPMAVSVAGLAMVGALAVACFVKVFGAVFLGEPRGPLPNPPHDAPPAMTWAMALLAVLCLVVGLGSPLLAPMIDSATSAWTGQRLGTVQFSAPLVPVSLAGAVLVFAAAGIGLWLRKRMQAAGVAQTATWDCGYLQPKPSMQYTASSFAQGIVELFGWLLRPDIQRQPPRSLFAEPSKVEVHVPDALLDRMLGPALYRTGMAAAALRVLQSGRTQVYFAYMLATLIALLFWT